MRLSPNEILILNVLQSKKKTMERLDISKQTGISDKNISAKLNSLEDKGLITSEKERKGRSTKRFITLTSAGRSQKLVKIVIEKKPKPTKPVKEDIITKYEKAKIKRRKKKEKVKPKIIISTDIREPVEPLEPEKITPKPLPATDELVKELELLINIGFTNRPAEYRKIGYKSKSELRAQISMLIGKLRG